MTLPNRVRRLAWRVFQHGYAAWERLAELEFKGEESREDFYELCRWFTFSDGRYLGLQLNKQEQPYYLNLSDMCNFLLFLAEAAECQGDEEEILDREWNLTWQRLGENAPLRMNIPVFEDS